MKVTVIIINQRAKNIFDNLIKERERIIDKLYESVDYNNLKFEYVGPTKNVSFYEYMNSKELFNKSKNKEIKYDDALKKQDQFLNNLSDIKIGKKTSEQKEVITDLDNFYNSREEVFNFFKDYARIYIDAGHKAKQDETEGTGLKILTPKQMLQRLPIALTQVNAANNSENLLNEIRKIVYSLYQSKEITKKVYNYIIKSVQ